jgi:hypothetical protein
MNKLIIPNHHPVNRKGLIGWWSYRNSGSIAADGIWKDYSGNGNHGTLANCYVNNKGVCLNGTNSLINCGTGKLQSITDKFIVASWCYINSASTNVGGLLNIGGVSNEISGFYIRVLSYNDAPLITLSNGTARDTQTFTTLTPLDQWFHIAFVIDGVTKKLYINGEFKESITLSISGPFTPNIGRDLLLGAGSNNNEIINGNFDDIQIYNRVLSAGETNLNYLKNKRN